MNIVLSKEQVEGLIEEFLEGDDTELIDEMVANALFEFLPSQRKELFPQIYAAFMEKDEEL